MSPEQFFIQQAIAHARSLPLAEAVLFLRGLLALAEGDDSLREVRLIYAALSESDRQLSLIETGQLRLPLDVPHNGDPKA